MFQKPSGQSKTRAVPVDFFLRSSDLDLNRALRDGEPYYMDHTHRLFEAGKRIANRDVNHVVISVPYTAETGEKLAEKRRALFQIYDRQVLITSADISTHEVD